MAQLFQAFNAPAPTTAGIVKVTTSTAIKTMLQIATPSTAEIKIVEWGISFDGSAAATPVLCELIDGDVAATGLTAHVAAGVPNLGNPNGPASQVTLGTGATGYNVSGGTENSITASRMLDAQLIAPTNQYIKQWPLGREPMVKVSRFLRIRVTTTPAVNALCYLTWEE